MTYPTTTPPPPPPVWPDLQSRSDLFADDVEPAADTSRPRRIRSAGGWILRLAFAAAGIAISLSIDGGIFGGLIALFVIVAPFEKLYPRKKGQKIRRPLASTDIAFALMNPLLNVVGIAVAVIIGGLSLFWLPGLFFRPLVGMIPPVVLPFVAFALFDFLAYWTHRWAHEVPLLWRFHAVHHSPEHMDWVSGFRIHPFDGILIAPAFFFFIAAGFDVELTGVLAVIQIILGIFFHANVRVRWRWLDRILANPEFHHWHHANESDAIGHNYAPALPLWDLLFGTYFMPKGASGRRPSNYGIDEHLPRNMIGMLTYPLRGARKHVRLLWHPIRAVKTVARGTGNILGDIGRSTFRRTHSVRRNTSVGCSSTNASLFDEPGPGQIPPGVVVEF